MATLKEKFLTTTGRINRMTFLKRNLAIVLALFIVFFVIEIIATPLDAVAGQQSTGAIIAETIVAFLLIVPEYCLNVQRLHDLGKDETLAKVIAGISLFSVAYGLTLSPDALLIESAVAIVLGIFNLIAFLYLLFAKGKPHADDYGVAQ